MEETKERRALRELVETIRANEEDVVVECDRGASGARVVTMTHQAVASAMREAETVLGIKVEK